MSSSSISLSINGNNFEFFSVATWQVHDYSPLNPSISIYRKIEHTSSQTFVLGSNSVVQVYNKNDPNVIIQNFTDYISLDIVDIAINQE